MRKFYEKLKAAGRKFRALPRSVQDGSIALVALTLEWDGIYWWTVKNTGAAT